MSWFSSKSTKMYVSQPCSPVYSSPVYSGKRTLKNASAFLQIQAFWHVGSLLTDAAYLDGMSLVRNSLRLALLVRSQPMHYCLVISGEMLSTLEHEDAFKSNQLRGQQGSSLSWSFLKHMNRSRTASCGKQKLGNGFSIYVNQMQFFFSFRLKIISQYSLLRVRSYCSRRERVKLFILANTFLLSAAKVNHNASAASPLPKWAKGTHCSWLKLQREFPILGTWGNKILVL